MSCDTTELSSSIIKIQRNDLEFKGLLGVGGCSTVFHAIWKNESENVHIAAKKINVTDAKSCELTLLSKLDHPNVIRLLAIVPDPFDFMLILELCENGSLRSYLDKSGQQPLSPDLFDSWSKQAAKAIEYLHVEKKIIHKDIKSGNYVISSDMVLKLTDFGISKLAEKTFSNASASGTVRYKAPELLIDSRLSPKSDIFAYGIVLWEMVTGNVPYEGMESAHKVYMHVCNENKRPEIPKDCPEYIAKLLRNCWLADHKMRPNIQKVLSILEAKECQSTTSEWHLHHQFGHQEEKDNPKLYKACAVAVSTDDHVAVFDYYSGSTHIYNNEGVFKSRFAVRQPNPSEYPFVPQPLIAGPNGTFILTTDLHQIKMYGSDGLLQNSFKVRFPRTPAKIGGLALDMTDQLLVGVYEYQEKVWSRAAARASERSSARSSDEYMSDDADDGIRVGKFPNLISRGVPQFRRRNFILVIKEFTKNEIDMEGLARIPLTIEPRFLAVTPLNSIIVIKQPGFVNSDLMRESWLQIVDKTGQVIRNLIDPPSGLTRFRATGVCCSSDLIFVTNDDKTVPNDYGVYCFTLKGDYIGCATNNVLNPVGVAISEDRNLMFVAQYEKNNDKEGQGKHGVKVFRRL